jgi:hypothetical protein
VPEVLVKVLRPGEPAAVGQAQHCPKNQEKKHKTEDNSFRQDAQPN